MSLAHYSQDASYSYAIDTGKNLGFLFLCADAILNLIAAGPRQFFLSLKGLLDCAFVITFIVVLSVEPNGFFRSTLQIAVTVRWIGPLSELGRLYRGSALFVLLNVVKLSLVHLKNM